jgi:arylsulfatase A-like enzyme
MTPEQRGYWRSGIFGFPPRRREPGAFALPALVVCLLLSGCNLLLTGCGGKSEKKTPSGIVLITIDTLRADRLGCTGHGAARTPVLDRLAREGTLFETVMVPAPITLPSHAALMTGRLPHEIAVRDNRPFALAKEADTLAEELSRAGFQTLAVVSGEPLAPGCGLEQGFDEYLFHPAPRQADVLLRESPADRTVNDALEAADRIDGEEPFFFWIHFFDPHIPYDPPVSLSDGDAYDGEVAFVDREIGRLLDGLEKRGMAEDTLFLITSDHGEGLGDHGEPTHAYFLYDSTLRVPFIARGPGVAAGRRVKNQVRFLDIPGAILTLLDLPGSRSPRAAKNLVALLQGKKRESRSDPIFSESLFCSHHFHWAELRAIRTDSFKIVAGAKIEIYDLETDPGETAPIPPDQARPEALRLAGTLEERIAAARPLSPPGPKLSGSLPGYFGGTAGGEKVFLGKEENSRRPHPTERTEYLNRFLKGVELSQAGSLNRARSLLEELFEEDPGNPSCAFWLGRTMRSLGEKEGDSRALEKAERLFSEAHRLDPGFLDAFYLATWCLIQLARFEDAEKILKRHLDREGDDPKGLELIGWLYSTKASKGRRNPLYDPARGLEAFERSLDLNQNNPRLLQKLITLYSSMKQPELVGKYQLVLSALE